MTRENDRLELVQQLATRDIHDPRVLEAMARTQRELFVPESSQNAAYTDRALPIEAGQTISQPYMVALMTQELLLRGAETVLEIGTGSGYQTAILASLCRRVVTIERIPELSVKARRRLDALGYTNVEFHAGDGSLGWADGAPYDRILVTAGAPTVPSELYRQLADGGRLVIPVGAGPLLKLQVIVKTASGPLVTEACDCSFVPLIGAEAWPAGYRNEPASFWNDDDEDQAE